MAKKQISNSIKLTFYNVVIQPVSQQSPERYKELINKIYSDKVAINTYSDKYTCIRILKEEGDLIRGQLVNYTELSNQNWYNSSTNETEDINLDPSLHPNAKKWEFYFLPKTHTLAVTSIAPVRQIDNFFTMAFNSVADKTKDEEIQFNVISSKDSIEKIVNAETLTSIEIVVSYSNNDNNEDWDRLIDESLKSSDVRRAEVKMTGSRKNPIKLLANSMIQGLLNLSRRNGRAKAIVYENGKREAISTSSSPDTATILYTDETNMIESIERKLGNPE